MVLFVFGILFLKPTTYENNKQNKKDGNHSLAYLFFCNANNSVFDILTSNR